MVTSSEIEFAYVPVIFQGNYLGHFTVGQDYPYYGILYSLGRAEVNVKDNFGVWHSFYYTEPFPQA